MEGIKHQLLAIEDNTRNKKILLFLTIASSFLSPGILLVNASKLIDQPESMFKYLLGLVVIQFLAQVVSSIYLYKNKLPNYFVWCVFLCVWLGQLWAGVSIVVLSNA